MNKEKAYEKELLYIINVDHDGDDVEGQSRAGFHGRDRVPRGVNGFVQGPPDEGAYGVGARQDDRREDGGAGPAPGDRPRGTGPPPGGQFGAGDFEGAGSARRGWVDERRRGGGLEDGDWASRQLSTEFLYLVGFAILLNSWAIWNYKNRRA